MFCYFSKNFAIKVRKTFFRNNIICYAFYTEFAIFAYFEKKYKYISKETQLLTVSVAF